MNILSKVSPFAECGTEVENLTVSGIRLTPTSILATVEIPPRLKSHGLPRSVFVKMSNGRASNAMVAKQGKKEAKFYDLLLSNNVEGLPVARCYHASCNEHGYQVILDDYSDTHYAGTWPLPPVEDECFAVMDCLALFHSYWWDHPQLEQLESFLWEVSSEGESTNLDGFRLPRHLPAHKMGTVCNQMEAMVQERVERFLGFLRDRISSRRRWYFKVVCSSPTVLWHRSLQSPCTLIHGDAHLGNFLYPREKSRHKVIMIDWQTWDINVATEDLSHFMALHWFPERRQRLEKALLKRYYDGLQQRGIEGYTWDQFVYDYKLSIARKVFLPIWQWHSGIIDPQVWWVHLERIMCAFEDWDCIALFL